MRIETHPAFTTLFVEFATKYWAQAQEGNFNSYGHDRSGHIVFEDGELFDIDWNDTGDRFPITTAEDFNNAFAQQVRGYEIEDDATEQDVRKVFEDCDFAV